MQSKIVSMRFDPAQGAHVARVDLERDGRTFRYPCRIEAPESAPRDWLEDALTRQALRMAASDRPARAPARPGLLRGIVEALARASAPRSAESEIPVRATDHRRPRARLH